MIVKCSFETTCFFCLFYQTWNESIQKLDLIIWKTWNNTGFEKNKLNIFPAAALKGIGKKKKLNLNFLSWVMDPTVYDPTYYFLLTDFCFSFFLSALFTGWRRVGLCSKKVMSPTCRAPIRTRQHLNQTLIIVGLFGCCQSDAIKPQPHCPDERN